MTAALRTLLIGALCLGVLGGMLVRHAWPLWAGETIYLKVRPVDPRDLFRGEYVTLGYGLDSLRLRGVEEPSAGPEPASQTAPDVDVVGDWVPPGWELNRLRDRRLYVQLRAEPSTTQGVPQSYVPVSVSDAPVDGAVNLAGRVASTRNGTIWLRYGIDALFVEEGRGRPIEVAIRNGAPIFAEIAVTADGNARVRALVIDGQRVP
jgi:uncharacterized membrane-anchored protein